MRISRYILLTGILVSLIVLPCKANEELSPVQEMSHLLGQLKKNPNDIQALIDAATTYINLCDYEGAKRMVSRLETVSHHHRDSVKAYFYNRLLSGWITLISGQCQDGLNTVIEAFKIAESHNMIAEQAMASNIMGGGYVNLNNLTTGLEYYNKALTSAKAIGDYKLVISILNNLSEAYLWYNDFGGIRYAEEALKLSREHDYKYGILTSLINIIHFKLFTMRDFDIIHRMVSEVEQLQHKYGFLPQGEINLIMARLAMVMGYNNTAVTIFEESLDDDAPIMPRILTIETLMHYSLALIKLEKYDEAIAVSKKALQLSQQANATRFFPYILSGISYCYEQTENYKQALSFLRDYNKHVDSLWISEQIKTLNQARIENEVRLNESTISRQQSQINTRGHYIIILTSIGIVLTICLLLLFRLYQRKTQLVHTVIQREKEAMVREKLLKQSLEQTRAELSAVDKSAPTTLLTEDRIDDLMVKFNEIMTENKVYTNANISIKSVAEALGTNRTYLSNSINRVFNKSFPQVLAEYRVRAAINMLNDPECDLPLKAIAVEVGFSSASVFFTTFRNIMGMTPTAYRNSILRKD